MAKIALNKSSLAKEREKLKLYQRVLPSLELKRQQLTAELTRSRRQLDVLEEEARLFEAGIAEQIPMLADQDIEVSGLVELETAEIGEENVVGIRLPVLLKLETKVAEYSFLAKPHWVDVLVSRLHQTTELRLKVQVARERVRKMELAVRRITQRVNLFDKIMIPSARRNIKRIQIFLGDADRSAVVRSKIAKKKRLKARADFFEQGVAQ